MNKDLKIFELNIDEKLVEDGIDYIALVKNPAVQYDFLMFNEQNKKQNFAIENVDEKIVLGVIMLADVPIFRNNNIFGEHYVVFSKEITKNILIKYFKEDKTGNVNLDHNKNKIVVDKGAFLFQAYIVNRQLGINPPTAFSEVTDGSIIGAFKIDDDALWNDIKSGKFKGFSIEGMFEYGNVVNESNGLKNSEFDEYMFELYKELSKIR